MTISKIIILISGQGSNFKAIYDYIIAQKLPIQISAVISNNPKAYGLTIAEQYKIKTFIVPDKQALDGSKLNSEDYSQSLLETIKPLDPDYIILAGFMRILSAEFINYYPNKILNIHPSLLPKYPGLNTYQRALDNKDQEHGCTVHLVNQDLDAGPIIAQSKCLITASDNAASLQLKTQKLEHQLYPKVIADLLLNKNK